jgi:hypothetical protein
MNVYVGQQISFDAVIPTSVEGGLTSQNWFWYDIDTASDDAPTNYAIGCQNTFSYSGSPCSASYILNASSSTGFQLSNFDLLQNSSSPYGSADESGSNYEFYWVSPVSNTYYLFYTYYTDYGEGWTWVGFNVSAPSITEYVCGGNVGSSACNSTNNGSLGTTIVNSSSNLGFGDRYTYGANYGIQFTASTTGVSGGTLMFVQTLTPYTFSWYNSYPSSKACTGTAVPASTPTLDNLYPYVSGSSPLTTSDNPDWAFPSSTYPGLTTDLHATMYTLWTPSGTNSIPVPLGYVSWSWDGIGTYNGTSWTASGSSTSSESGFTASSVYPTWSYRYVNGTSVTCYP